MSYIEVDRIRKSYGGSLALSASASSGLPVAFAVSGPATLNGSTLTFTGAGSVTVTASQAGNATYNAAADVIQTFAVQPKPVTFTLSQTGFTYDGLAKTTTVVASDPAATFSTGGTLSATSAGPYTATATASGNYSGSNHALAWTIGPASQILTLTPAQATISSGTPVTFTATGGGGTGAYSWGGTAGIFGSDVSCSVALNTPGSYAVTVAKAGDANHRASNTALASLLVTNTPPTSVLTASALSLRLGQPLTLTAVITDPDANLASLSVDVSTDNTAWTPGTANWAGPTAWAVSGALDSRVVAFTPTATGTWYFRSAGTDSAGAASNTAVLAVTVTEPAPAAIKVIPHGSSVTVQDTDKTKHTQIRVP